MYVETALNMTAKIQYMDGAKDIIIQKFMKMIRHAYILKRPYNGLIN